MPYYSITVHEKKPGSRFRRNMSVEATSREQAKSLFQDKCLSIGFIPDPATLKEISKQEFEHILAILLGIDR